MTVPPREQERHTERPQATVLRVRLLVVAHRLHDKRGPRASGGRARSGDVSSEGGGGGGMVATRTLTMFSTGMGS